MMCNFRWETELDSLRKQKHSKNTRKDFKYSKREENNVVDDVSPVSIVYDMYMREMIFQLMSY